MKVNTSAFVELKEKKQSENSSVKLSEFVYCLSVCVCLRCFCHNVTTHMGPRSTNDAQNLLSCLRKHLYYAWRNNLLSRTRARARKKYVQPLVQSSATIHMQHHWPTTNRARKNKHKTIIASRMRQGNQRISRIIFFQCYFVTQNSGSGIRCLNVCKSLVDSFQQISTWSMEMSLSNQYERPCEMISSEIVSKVFYAFMQLRSYAWRKYPGRGLTKCFMFSFCRIKIKTCKIAVIHLYN